MSRDVVQAHSRVWAAHRPVLAPFLVAALLSSPQLTQQQGEPRAGVAGASVPAARAGVVPIATARRGRRARAARSAGAALTKERRRAGREPTRQLSLARGRALRELVTGARALARIERFRD